MATKTVTLKDSNGDTLYPVTDSNVVNINQQKTLAQALDGVVYADDPTAPANPNAWIAPNDIDWSTFPGRIIAVGQINVGSVSANNGKEATEYIPTQADSNYAVILTHAVQTNGYDKCMPAVKYKYTDRFVANIWNSGSSASGNILLDYVVIKY